MVLVLFFVVLGVVFSRGRRSGLPLRLLPLNHPQDHKNQYQDRKKLPRDSLLAPPGRLLTVLEKRIFFDFVDRPMSLIAQAASPGPGVAVSSLGSWLSLIHI